MTEDLEQGCNGRRTAVITGAASGIGLAVAHRLAAGGAVIVGIDRSDDLPEALKELPGSGHLPVRADVTDREAVSRAVDELVAEVGVPQILVNSAGVALLGPAEDLSAEDWTRTLDINLSGSFYVAQALGRLMVQAGYGRIINMASQAAVIGLEDHVAYCASKAGILGMTRALSLEWAPRGVTVNAISPTVVETPLGKKAWAGEKGEKARAAIPTRRFAQPEEIAGMVEYLASEEAGMITGSNMLIDGGFTAV